MSRRVFAPVALLLAACLPQDQPAADVAAAGPPPLDTVVLETSRGRIVMELNREMAPVSVDNFVLHVRSGFYDGLVFHRVAPDFVIQAGRVMENMAERKTSAPPMTSSRLAASRSSIEPMGVW